jgi:hypothetical protein
MFADSIIDSYNKFVDKKCEEVMKKNKIKSNRDYLSPNRTFNKELGGFVAQQLLNKQTFKNIIKNSYKYLGEKALTEPELEDLYKKGFDTFSIDEFMEYIDLIQSGRFATIGEAFNSFKKELDDRTATASMTMTPSSIAMTPSIDFGDPYTQVYPPAGAEAEYGFAKSGINQEVSNTARKQLERERIQAELSGTGIRPVLEKSIFTGKAGRPSDPVVVESSGFIERTLQSRRDRNIQPP